MTKKTIAKIVFGFTLALTIAVGIWAHLYQEPYRLVEQYYDALERGDEKAFEKYSDGGVTINEALKIALSDSGFTEEDDPEFKVKFLSREENGDSVWITVKLTIYNDERHFDTEKQFIYSSGKLQIDISAGEKSLSLRDGETPSPTAVVLFLR
jgi:hypothetical protein